jgi:hypothetical protein
MWALGIMALELGMKRLGMTSWDPPLSSETDVQPSRDKGRVNRRIIDRIMYLRGPLRDKVCGWTDRFCCVPQL